MCSIIHLCVCVHAFENVSVWLLFQVRGNKKPQDCDVCLKTAEDPVSEWLKPMYIEPCPYNMMTAIQNTILSRSRPRQPYWMQANREHVNKQSEMGETGVRLEPGQALPVIDASKEKTRKQLTVNQFIRREYESYLVTDDESTQCEDGLSVNSSALEAEHNSSSDDSRVRQKKRLNIKSPQEVLPSRVQPLHWSKSDSEIILRPSFSVKSCQNSKNINLERNVRSLSSVGRPAVMPRKARYKHYGLVAPNVELKRKRERISALPANYSCLAETSGSDTWDSHAFQCQNIDQTTYFAGIRKGQVSSQETGDSRHSERKPDEGTLCREQFHTNLGDIQKENMKRFQNKVGSDTKDADEKINTSLGEPTRLLASGSRSIADIIKTGRMVCN